MTMYTMVDLPVSHEAYDMLSSAPSMLFNAFMVLIEQQKVPLVAPC